MAEKETKVTQYSKMLTRISIFFGILFPGLLVVFVITTSEFPSVIVIPFLFLSLFFFIMAYWSFKLDKKFKERDGWMQLDRGLKFAILIMKIAIIIELLIIPLGVIVDQFSETNPLYPGFIYHQIIRLGFYVVILFFCKGQLQVMGGYESKFFPGWSSDNIIDIEEILHKHLVPFSPLGESKEKFGFSFNHVYKLNHGIFLKIKYPAEINKSISWIHPNTGFDFTLYLGPKTNQNEIHINRLKDIVNSMK